MLLTIVIPTKNSEATIRYALASILRQRILEKQRFELIIVDGYSTDGTLDIVREYLNRFKKRFGDNFERYVILQESIGIGYARNLALKIARGQWIIWVDSDNILSPNYIESVIKEIMDLKDDKVAVLYPYRTVPLYHKHSRWGKILVCHGLTQLMDPQTDTKGSFPYYPMQGAVCRTDVLRLVGGFDPRLIAAEDIDIYARIIQSGYKMKSFKATLYTFVKPSLKSWFLQAMTWEYGKRVVLQKTLLPPSLRRDLEGIKSKNVFLNALIRYFNTMLLTLIKGIRICGIIGVLLPFIYTYRRSGFMKGLLIYILESRVAKKQCVV